MSTERVTQSIEKVGDLLDVVQRSIGYMDQQMGRARIVIGTNPELNSVVHGMFGALGNLASCVALLRVVRDELVAAAPAEHTADRLAEARKAVARYLDSLYVNDTSRRADALLALPELRALIGGEQQ